MSGTGYVWAWCDWDNCEEGHTGTLVVALFTSRQAAEQARDRAEKRAHGPGTGGFVQSLQVHTNLDRVPEVLS